MQMPWTHTLAFAEPELLTIPAGEFLMGSDPAKDPDAGPEEQPQHTVALPEFAIGRTPVTCAQYLLYLRETHARPPAHWRFLRWRIRRIPAHQQEHPITQVSWYEAVAYCEWLAARTGKPYRLPSEAEWEKAARGVDGRRYPWGDAWEATRCNIQPEREGTTPVNAFPAGASPYGVLDMVGNVWEWTRSLWGEKLHAPAFRYPYAAGDGRENQAAPEYVRRVLRGVSFYNEAAQVRCAARYRYSPHNSYASVGFRVALGGREGERG